eukprot:COSAG02_NODE_5928_length_3936_cov_9.495960_4_plen_70_part_00
MVQWMEKRVVGSSAAVNHARARANLAAARAYVATVRARVCVRRGCVDKTPKALESVSHVPRLYVPILSD